MKRNQLSLLARVWTLSLFLVLAGVTPLAQQKTPPAPGAPRPLNLPNITEKKLGNGLTVVLAPLPSVPKLTVLLAFPSANNSTDRQRHPGIAQLVAGVANEGTDTRTSKQLKDELRSIGGTVSVGSDADSTQIFGIGLSEFSTHLFEIMSDIAQHPLFPEEEVSLAKENTIQSIRAARGDANFLANERFQKAVFGNHPYSFVVPDEKSIAALTRGDMKAFVNSYYIPNNAHLIVVGDIDPGKTFAEIEKAFGSWKRGTVVEEDLPAPPTREKRQIYFVNRPGSIQSTIFIGNTTIARKHQDYFALRTADSIFGGSFYSRLTRNIREDKGYTYSPFSASNTQAKAGSFQAGASVRNEVTGPTLLEMFYELDRMRVLPVSDEELTSAKEFSNGNFSIELASQSGLAGRLNTIYTYGLSKTFINDFRTKIGALTPADIEKAAAKYFDTYHSVIVIVGDYEKVKDQVAPFGEVTLYDADGNVIPR